jgi:glycosyltransferase involved in cell wall biosynthesis
VAPHGGELRPRGVEVLGELSNTALSSQMSTAAIYALPARYEPFGLSVLEAALCGCTLVLGDIPSLREVWGDAAVYVPPDDLVALRRALDALIADDAARARLAVAARMRAFGFGRDRMLAEYAQAYRELQPALGAFLEEIVCV